MEKFLEEMKKIQSNLLDYIDSEMITNEKYQNLKSNHYLIIKISNNHHLE